MLGMPNAPAPLTFDDPDIETALFRHGLIAHLIHHPPDSGRLEAELRHLAAQTYVIPHASRKRTRVSLASLRRYYRTYRAHGFEALLPKGRRDAGVPQAFDPAVLKQAIALREQPWQPKLPVTVGACMNYSRSMSRRRGGPRPSGAAVCLKLLKPWSRAGVRDHG